MSTKVATKVVHKTQVAKTHTVARRDSATTILRKAGVPKEQYDQYIKVVDKDGGKAFEVTLPVTQEEKQLEVVRHYAYGDSAFGTPDPDLVVFDVTWDTLFTWFDGNQFNVPTYYPEKVLVFINSSECPKWAVKHVGKISDLIKSGVLKSVPTVEAPEAKVKRLKATLADKVDAIKNPKKNVPVAVNKCRDKKEGENCAVYCRNMILLGHSNIEIFEAIKTNFGHGDDKRGYPAWYRHKMREAGLIQK